jgi:hypothetical protein
MGLKDIGINEGNSARKAKQNQLSSASGLKSSTGETE